MNKENNIILGILFMTLAMFCLSVNDVLVKGLSSAYPIWEVIFFRALSGFIISVVLVVVFGLCPTELENLWGLLQVLKSSSPHIDVHRGADPM